MRCFEGSINVQEVVRAVLVELMIPSLAQHMCTGDTLMAWKLNCLTTPEAGVPCPHRHKFGRGTCPAEVQYPTAGGQHECVVAVPA
jgi:hypothetical protein